MPLFGRKDKSRYASFTRRTLLLGGGMSAVFTVLAGRLYQLQILEGRQYQTAAEDNRINERLVAPLRGRILDRFGVELANNRRDYRILLIPEQATDGVESALASVSRVVEIAPHQHEKILRDIAQNKKFVPVTVVENLSWDEFALINLHLPYLPGIQPDVGETRAYPYAAQLAHVVGYVAAVSQEDKKADTDPLLDLPGFRIGKRGIEKKFDQEIRGSAGASRVEVNAYGRVIRELGREAGTPGKDVYLTIDQQLQQFVNQRLGEESAACVVMDVENGDVLALDSTPGFDPNLFNVGITNDQWKTWTTDDHKPLLNKTLGGVYPPGSTFKPAVAMAAVESGITPDFSVFCTGTLTLGNHDFHCWKAGGHGRMTLRDGIKHSCDVFFYEVSRRIGIDQIEKYAHILGFGQPTGIELPGELGGTIPGRAWKEARFGVPWQQGETLNTGIGQGYVLVTPLQLCTMTARIAGGKAVSPRIAHTIGATTEPRLLPEPMPFSPQAYEIVRSGMAAVANEPGGTAYSWRITEPGFEMAGKTGTAQVRVITRQERQSGVRKDQSLPWNLRDHGLFVAFAPVSAPRYACATIVEHGALGHPQVQMARDVLLFAQKRSVAQLPTRYPVTSASLGAG